MASTLTFSTGGMTQALAGCPYSQGVMPTDFSPYATIIKNGPMPGCSASFPGEDIPTVFDAMFGNESRFLQHWRETARGDKDFASPEWGGGRTDSGTRFFTCNTRIKEFFTWNWMDFVERQRYVAFEEEGKKRLLMFYSSQTPTVTCGQKFRCEALLDFTEDALGAHMQAYCLVVIMQSVPFIEGKIKEIGTNKTIESFQVLARLAPQSVKALSDARAEHRTRVAAAAAARAAAEAEREDRERRRRERRARREQERSARAAAEEVPSPPEEVLSPATVTVTPSPPSLPPPAAAVTSPTMPLPPPPAPPIAQTVPVPPPSPPKPPLDAFPTFGGEVRGGSALVPVLVGCIVVLGAMLLYTVLAREPPYAPGLDASAAAPGFLHHLGAQQPVADLGPTVSSGAVAAAGPHASATTDAILRLLHTHEARHVAHRSSVEWYMLVMGLLAVVSLVLVANDVRRILSGAGSV